MSQLGGNDSKTVRCLVLMVVVMALVVPGTRPRPGGSP